MNTTNRELIELQWGRQRRDAGHLLAGTSVLREHFLFPDLVVLRHRDDGPDMADVQALDEFTWSSGERILVNLFLTFAGFPRAVGMWEILSLDPANRNAAGNAISVACAQGWHPSTQSYEEVF